MRYASISSVRTPALARSVSYARRTSAKKCGKGTLTVTPHGAPSMEADMTLSLGAVGLRGVVVPRTEADGLEVAVEADALLVRASSDATRGMAGAEADASRLRLGLEGSWRRSLDGGGSFTPSFEVGVRHDGGDAETGFGVDLGGGVAWADPGSGLGVELNARGLLAHEAAGFREWGVSGALRYDPAPASDRGLALTLAPSWSAASRGGADALLGRETLAGLALDEARAQRARRNPWKRNDRNSVAGRDWYDWLPIFELSEAEVFETIQAAGQTPHPVYAQGLSRCFSRCSCSFCIFSSRADLRRAAELRPGLYTRYAELKRRIGHTLSPLAHPSVRADRHPHPIDLPGPRSHIRPQNPIVIHRHFASPPNIAAPRRE